MSTQLAPVDDPNAIDPFSNDLWTRVGPVEWTDCVGDTPLADGEVEQSGGSGPYGWTQTRRYFGLGGDQTTDAQGAATATNYWHEDLIGSRSMVSDDAGELAGRIAYSAFGELLDASGLPGGAAPAGSPRYQYAAAHGYESDLLTLQGPNTDLPPITLQHLGHRWYQPDTGRFVQRDPIGLAGGLNVYAYVGNSPSGRTDPTGLMSTIYTPAGLSVFIELQLALGRTVSIAINGRLVAITGTAVMPVNSAGQSTLMLRTANGCVQYTFRRAAIVQTRTSTGWVLQPPSSSACGATGIEAAPFLLLYAILSQRRRRLAMGNAAASGLVTRA